MAVAPDVAVEEAAAAGTAEPESIGPFDDPARRTGSPESEWLLPEEQT
jgi:hypothetical protein